MKLTEFADYILNDLLIDIEGITAKRMFRGYGIYQHGIIFALIANDELYFKVDDTNKHQYQKYHSKPFTYSRKDG